MRRNFQTSYLGLAVFTLLAASGCGAKVKIPSTVLANFPVVAAGFDTTCILDPTGKPVCFGSSVGDSTWNAHTEPFTQTSFGKIKSIALSSGTNVGCVVEDNAMSTVICWGYQGVDNSTSIQLPKTPTTVPGVQPATAVSAGHMGACAILVGGSVECWNFNDQSDTPINIAIQSGLTQIAQISVGFGHACAIQSDQSVLCWGQNEHGQLGNGQVAASSLQTFPPAVVPGLKAVSGHRAVLGHKLFWRDWIGTPTHSSNVSIAAAGGRNFKCLGCLRRREFQLCCINDSDGELLGDQ